MVKKVRKGPGAGRGTELRRILESIEPHDALDILRALADEEAAIARRIGEIARDHLSGVEIKDVADDVFSTLDGIAVEEVWDNAGSTRHGYVDPIDLAWEMFEDALTPFLEQMKKYRKLGMDGEAKRFCMGILQGLHRFDEESVSGYKDYVEDAPYDWFKQVLKDWSKECKRPKDIEEVEAFVRESLPRWWSDG